LPHRVAELGGDGLQDTILVSVGDLVNKGPKNAETLRYFRSLASSSLTVNEGDNKANTVEPRPFRVFHVRGNHEEALINTDRNKWTEELTEDEMQYLADLPYTLSFPSIGTAELFLRLHLLFLLSRQLSVTPAHRK